MSGITEIFFGALVVAFSGALVPGPMFTLVVTSAAQKGFGTSFFIVVGHSLLELVIVIMFFLGILKYLDNPVVVRVISIIGGTFLLYMAASIIYSVIKKRVRLDLDKNSIKGSLGTRNTFIIVGKGILISLANPYWYIWWLTIGAAFMVRSVTMSFGGVSAFYVGHILADFIWFLFVGFVVSTGRRFLNQKVYIGILLACSAFLVYLGIRFIVDFFIL
jgi:threonine/homoserine/homoserine lactone efflux protein